MGCGYVLLSVDVNLLIAECMSLVDMSQSVRCLLVSQTMFSMSCCKREGHLWLCALWCDLGQVILALSGHQLLCLYRLRVVTGRTEMMDT